MLNVVRVIGHAISGLGGMRKLLLLRALLQKAQLGFGQSPKENVEKEIALRAATASQAIALSIPLKMVVKTRHPFAAFSAQVTRCLPHLLTPVLPFKP